MRPGTPIRYVRISDALWDEFKDATEAADTNPSETIRQLIREWVRKQGEQDNG